MITNYITNGVLKGVDYFSSDFWNNLDYYEEEKDDKYIIKFEAPGITKETAIVKAEGTQLLIKLEYQHKNDFGRIPKVYTYSRKNALIEKAKANLKDGVLTIDIPKKESKKIDIIVN